MKLVAVAVLLISAGCGRDSRQESRRMPPTELLGTVTAPSGRLVILDCGYLGDPAATDLAAVPHVETKLPAAGTTPLQVRGVRITEGEFEGLWESVSVEWQQDQRAVKSELIGRVAVDWARLMFIDALAVKSWVHEESLDGRADFVFWGRDAPALAAAVDAPTIEEGQFGWVDLPVEEAVRVGTAAEERKEEQGWMLATDYRPHSHPYLVLDKVRASATESGTIDVGGASVCVFMTRWGDGNYAVYRDIDASGALVRLRVQLSP